MSRIFKSNYVKVGTPKPIKSNPTIIKAEVEPKQQENLAERAEAHANSIIEDAKELYLKIIEEANFEAQRILDKAREEKEAIEANASEDGYREGFNAGYNEGLNQAGHMIMEAQDIKHDLDESRKKLYTQAEEEIMELVLEISRKVIGLELTQNKDAIFSIIHQALSKCAFKNKLTIRVSEYDYDHVNSHKDKIIMLTEGISDLEVNCDKALPQGSCIVETTSGEVNAGVEVQINEIQKAFEYIIRNE